MSQQGGISFCRTTRLIRLMRVDIKPLGLKGWLNVSENVHCMFSFCTCKSQGQRVLLSAAKDLLLPWNPEQYQILRCTQEDTLPLAFAGTKRKKNDIKCGVLCKIDVPLPSPDINPYQPHQPYQPSSTLSASSTPSTNFPSNFFPSYISNF